MITIHHILKDGTEVPNITGHVIKADEFETLYQVVNRINERTQHESVRTPEERS
ncbi:BOW99_gp33 family protein [Anaerotignum sp.]